MPLKSNFNGSKKHKRRRDQDLRDAVALLPSARKVLKRPYFLPVQPELQNEMGTELIEWSCDKDSNTIDEFFAKRLISPSHFFRLCESNEFLASCLDIALSNIAARLEDKVKNNQLYIMNKLKHYSFLSREEARLKREAEKDVRVITTYVEEKIGIPVFTNKKKE